MDIYISSYKNFDKIPQNVICVGVTKKTPTQFCTTTIRNFLYTPRSILSGEFPSDNSLTKEQFFSLYVQHLQSKTKDFGSVQNYFSQMFTEFSQMFNGEFKGFCFLGDDEYSNTDMTFFIRKLLTQFGYNVKTFGCNVTPKTDDSLF